MVSNFKTNLITVFAFLRTTRSKPAYGLWSARARLDRRARIQFGVFSMSGFAPTRGQGGREEKEVVIRIIFFRLYFFASMVLAALHIYRRSGLMHDVAI